MSVVINTNTSIKTQTIVNTTTAPKDGLIYYVDAAGPISHPVSSPYWNDLSSTKNRGEFFTQTWQLISDGEGGYYFGWGGSYGIYPPKTSSEYGGGIIYDGYVESYPTSSIVTQATLLSGQPLFGVGGPAALQPDNITVNVWFKVSGSYFGTLPNPNNTIFRSRLAGYGIFQKSNNTIETIIHNGGTPPINSSFGVPSNNFSSSFNLNQVYNYTFSLGSNTFKTYINGTLVYQTASNGNTITYNKDILGGGSYGNNTVAIGCDGDDIDRFFQGTVYNLQVYNRALSDTEVSSLFNYFNTVRGFNV
jgi:hypothetical protein